MKLFTYFLLIHLIWLMGCAPQKVNSSQKSFEAELWDLTDAFHYNLRNQDYGLALQKVQSAERSPKTAGAENTWNERKQLVFRDQGKYEQAIEVRKLSVSSMDNLWLEKDLGDLYVARGDFVRAREYYDEQKIKRERQQRLHPDWHMTKESNRQVFWPSLAEYELQTGNAHEAIRYLEEYLEAPPNYHERSKHQNSTARACIQLGDYETAEQLLSEASRSNAAAFVTFPDILGESLALLGEVAKARGENSKALQAYESAINVLQQPDEQWPGRYRTQTADTFVKLGEFHLILGELEKARASYQRAVQLRHDTATQTHPNCADAMKGLASVDAAEGKFAEALTQQRAALAVLDEALVPTHPRIAHHLIALSALESLNGNSAKAAELDTRLNIILQKPLAIWKEDFLETAEFYAKLLKKNGKAQAAERLDSLRKKQEGKR